MKSKTMFHRFTAVVSCAALVCSLPGCQKDQGSTTAAATSTQATTQDQVKKVQVAHTISYPPYDFLNDKKDSDGYEVAVMKAIDDLLPQYEFVFNPTNDDDVLVGLQSGKYDVGIKGIWWTAAREETYLFPEHYIGTSVIGIAFPSKFKDQFTDLESFAKNSGKLIPIPPSSAQYAIVQNFNDKHPDTPIKLLESDVFIIADAYQWLIEGRYDAFFDIKTTFDANVTDEAGEYHHLADQLSYIPYEGIPTWPLFNKEDTELAAAYDRAWETLKENGTLEKLADDYFGYSLFDYVPEGYQKGDAL